jgi:Spy/CpxP family protein refolding chaperone
MSTSPGLLDRLTLGGTWNPKLVATISLTLVFLCGGVVGALVMDLGVHNRQRPAAFETAQGQTMYFEHLQKELDLSPAQSEQVKSILGDFWQYYRTVLSECRGRIDQILTPDQRAKFDRLLQDQKR